MLRSAVDTIHNGMFHAGVYPKKQATCPAGGLVFIFCHRNTQSTVHPDSALEMLGVDTNEARISLVAVIDSICWM